LKAVYNVQSLRFDFHQVCLWYFLTMEWKRKYDSYVFCFSLGVFFISNHFTFYLFEPDVLPWWFDSYVS
jgi:hypothetical protein